MRRRAVCVAVGLLAFAVVEAPTDAQEETGISGQVESTVELSLKSVGSGRVEATVSATVSDTELRVSVPGRATRVLDSYRDPVTGKKVTVTADGAKQQTITFGPQSP